MESTRTDDHEYSFTLICRGVPEPTKEVEDALATVGCADATLWSGDGVFYLYFSRRAASLEDAPAGALRAVHKVGISTTGADWAE